MNGIRTVSVVRALGGLGDFLCAVPALSMLRAALPAAKISYVGIPATEPIVARFKMLIDQFVPFPGFPGIVEYPFALPELQAFLEEVRSGPRPDLAIQMHGSGSVSNPFTALLCARRTAGYHLPDLWRPDPGSYWPFPAELSESQRWVALMDRLGFDETKAVAFPIDDADIRAATSLVPDQSFAILHPGASEPSRRWPPERFAQVGNVLARRGLRVVVTGVRAEDEIVARTVAAMEEPALNLCGRTPVGPLAALVQRARVVVTNDTGTSHLAAALGTPSVVMFLTSDPDRWAPADRDRHRVLTSPDPQDAMAELEALLCDEVCA